MILTIPPDITAQFEQVLATAGRREIGGIMMAEHTGTNKFTVREITVHRLGAFASFLRRIEEALTALSRFFEKTQHNYLRFNYIGEWHSHPSFIPYPSPRDHDSMIQIISDKSVGANFVVLVVLKLGRGGRLEGSAHTYIPDIPAEESQLIIQY